MISTLFFFLQNDNKMRVMGNPTTVLEMYPHIKEIFIAGGCEVTIDDIKGFLQFPTILGPSLSKSICSSSLRDSPLIKVKSFLVFATSSP